MLGMSSKRETMLGVWLHAHSSNAAKPGNGTAYMCAVHVPFRHRLVKAVSTTPNAVVDNGTLTLKLIRVDDAEAPSGGDDMSAAASIAAATGVVTVTDITITGTKQCYKKDVTYMLVLVGTDNSTRYAQPSLALCVVPIPRPAL